MKKYIIDIIVKNGEVVKNSRKFILLIIGILVILAIFFIIQIYAKYLSSAKGDTTMAIAKWNILVNNLSIKNNTDISNTIVPVFPGNENIAKDIIAPTAEGYFDLEFNFKDADVSCEYEITTSVDENSTVKDLVVTGYSIDDGEKIVFDEYNEPIKEQINLDDNIEIRKIRVYILWNDDEQTQQMTNADDTASTVDGLPAILKVNISFKQSI